MSVPIDQPHYGIGPAGMVRWLRKYATFRGRASRSELWWGALAHSIVVGVLTLPGTVLTILALARANAAAASAFTIADSDSSTRPAAPFAGIAAWLESLLGASEVAIAVGIGAAASLLVLVPLLALWWRRLQDAGAHGALAFVALLAWSFAGVVMHVVLGALPSSREGLRFDASPHPVPPPAPVAAPRPSHVPV